MSAKEDTASVASKSGDLIEDDLSKGILQILKPAVEEVDNRVLDVRYEFAVLCGPTKLFVRPPLCHAMPKSMNNVDFSFDEQIWYYNYDIEIPRQRSNVPCTVILLEKNNMIRS